MILKDSGIVSKGFSGFFGRKFIKDEINEMAAVSPSGFRFSLKSGNPYAYLLEREKFSFFLRKLAKKNAEVRYESAKKVEYHDGFANVITDKNEHECRMVIGCDGANSVVRKSSGIKDPGLVAGLFSFAKKKMKEDRINVFFNKNYSEDFFSWLIPQSREYGLIAGKDAINFLYRFIADKNLSGGRIYGSQIPIGFTKSFAERTVLVGDSCGQVKPISCGGIVFSLTACRHAAETIKAAFDKHIYGEKFLSQYEKKWKADFGSEIRRQLFFRKMYGRLSNKQIDRLFIKFGPHMEKINDFDYDHISSSWTKMPRLKMIASLPLFI